MMGSVRRGLLLLSPVLLLVPVGLAGQQQGQTQQAKPDSTPSLVYEREVFTYPTYGRRNPFLPLVGQNQGGPRFEQLRLIGILYDPSSPKESVATVGTSTVTVSEDGTNVSVGEGQTWYLKVGQTLGNIRVVDIRPDQLVVDVEEFGLATRKTMQIQTRRLGGGTP